MAHALRKTSPKRSSRIDFRATRAEERLIRLGAECRSQEITQFIVKSACSEAEIALADQKHFKLPPNKFAEFARALDRPAKVIPALQNLFSQASTIDH